MGRKKISIQPITEERNRHVTFNKRKQGLIKKAMELSILCNCQISLVIFNSENQLFEYCSTDPRSILQRYCQVAHLPHERLTNNEYTKFDKTGNIPTGSSDLGEDVNAATSQLSSDTNTSTTAPIVASSTSTTVNTTAAVASSSNDATETPEKKKKPKKKKSSSKKRSHGDIDSDENTTTTTSSKTATNKSAPLNATVATQPKPLPLSIPNALPVTAFNDAGQMTPSTLISTVFGDLGGSSDITPLTPRTTEQINNVVKNAHQLQQHPNVYDATLKQSESQSSISTTPNSSNSNQEAESPSTKKRKTSKPPAALTITVPQNQGMVPLKRIDSNLETGGINVPPASAASMTGGNEFAPPPKIKAETVESASSHPTPNTGTFSGAEKTPLSSLLNSNFFDTSTTPTSLGVNWDIPSPYTVLKENQAKMEKNNKDKI